jgi:hypothetical protein
MDAVVIAQFVPGDDNATAMDTWHRSLRVKLTFWQMDLKAVKFYEFLLTK